jgi:hypothetical protein
LGLNANRGKGGGLHDQNVSLLRCVVQHNLNK